MFKALGGDVARAESGALAACRVVGALFFGNLVVRRESMLERVRANRARLQVNLRIEELVRTYAELREHGDAVERARDAAVLHRRRERGVPDAPPSGVGGVRVHGELHEPRSAASGLPKQARRTRRHKGKLRGNAYGSPERPVGEDVELELHAKGGRGHLGPDASCHRAFDGEARLPEVPLEPRGFGGVRAPQARVDEAVDSDGSAWPARMHAEVPCAPTPREPPLEAAIERRRLRPADAGEEPLDVEGPGGVHVGVHGVGADAAVPHVVGEREPAARSVSPTDVSSSMPQLALVPFSQMPENQSSIAW